MRVVSRVKLALSGAFVHLLGSAVVAALSAAFVFGVWYPHPYELLSGGRSLFLLLVGVDVVCGPLLTLVLLSPNKSKKEIYTDLALVFSIQIAALVYGFSISYLARPLYVVHEVDRFRVITAGDYGDVDVSQSIAGLGSELRPRWFKGPLVVGIRDPKDSHERQDVMLESSFGGRDYSQRPDFYVPYDDTYKVKVLSRARPLSAFIARYPEYAGEAKDVLMQNGLAVDAALFLPVVHKQQWVALLDNSAHILGFIPGDGFEVP
ncbi:pilus assembly protein [Hydrogenophaga sp.]|uniref:pilus assembly protein n=1 Tax=Hydrogenophaga sp. TaxID=1904254 RepID=UPI0035AF1B62